MDTQQNINPWFFLNYHGKIIKEEIIDNWKSLLNDASKKETDFHEFISGLPRYFFNGEFESEFVVINKLKLGADLVTDLVLGIDGRSGGFNYTLIELESPHDNIFNKDGSYSKHLSKAIHQIRSWRIWIRDNSELAKKLFCCYSTRVDNMLPNFSYKIIIGRRKQLTPEFEIHKNQLLRDSNIEVRTYDYLTDILGQKTFPAFIRLSHAIMDGNKADINSFICPFSKAYSDKQWRKIINNSSIKYYHMVTSNLQLLLNHRELNHHYYEKFHQEFSKQPEDVKNFYRQLLAEEAKEWYLNM